MKKEARELGSKEQVELLLTGCKNGETVSSVPHGSKEMDGIQVGGYLVVFSHPPSIATN